MRIGILTFHRAINYGAFLQAFALKTYVESLGHYVEIIDYWPKHHADPYSLLYIPPKASLLGKIKSFVYAWVKLTRAARRKKAMTQLFLTHFGLGSDVHYSAPEGLRAVDYDCIIYGSDQIWSSSVISAYDGFDEVFWGEFVPEQVKKIAYAPSMGVIDISDDQKAQIKSLLKNFDSLSVRETMLKAEIGDLTDRDIPVVLDPVFLMEKSMWKQFCRPVNKGRYILFYNLMQCRESDEVVARLSSKMDCKVIEITGRVEPLKFGKRYVQTASAFEFISYIKDAEFVVSTSFHGTAFSILFEKQFFSVGMQNNSGRVASLLGLLGIEDRLVIDESSPLPQSSIDYSVTTSNLDHIASESRSYLCEVLSR